MGVTSGILVEGRKCKVRRKTWLPVFALLAASCAGGSPETPQAAPSEAAPAPAGTRVSVPPLPIAGVPPTEAPPGSRVGDFDCCHRCCYHHGAFCL